MSESQQVCDALTAATAPAAAQVEATNDAVTLIAALEAAVAPLEAEVADLTVRLEQAGADLDAKDATIAAQQADIDAKSAALIAAADALDRAADEVDRQHVVITAQAAEIATKDATITAQLDKIATQTATISAQVTTINQRDATIAAQNTTIATQTATIAARDATIATQTATIATQTNTIAARNATISAQSATIAARDAEIVTLNARIADLEDQLSGQDGEDTLVPKTGALFGVTAATTGTKGSTSTVGLASWLNATGDHYPHIISRYYTGTRSWVFTAEEKQMFDPTTGPHAGKHAIPLLHWKLSGTWAQVAAGQQNAAIDQFVAGIRQYPRKIFMVLPHHEPELEIGAAGSGYTAADYRAMHRHFVTYVRNAYLPAKPNIEFVMQYTGYSNFADEGFETLYAGDDVVDWIGWDPYPHSFTRNTWAKLLNETISSGGVPSYTGFYNWARAAHPAKPLMLTEWGLDITTTTGMGQANVSTVLTNYRTQVQAFPEVKAVVYWNSLTENGNYQMQGTTCGDEMSALIELPWFTQNLAAFP